MKTGEMTPSLNKHVFSTIVFQVLGQNMTRDKTDTALVLVKPNSSGKTGDTPVGNNHIIITDW